MRRDDASLLDILLAARLAVKFVAGWDFDRFAQDQMVQDAVIRRLEIIGEASRRISEGFKQEHPEIPWPQMSGMRNKLIHEYDRVDIEVVWDVIMLNLPSLIVQLEPLVPPPDEGGDTTDGPSV